MIKMGMWETITQAEVPKDTTWAMKKKSSGSFRARVNAIGLMKIAGEHYNSDIISSPFLMKHLLELFCDLYYLQLANHIVDLKGAFLCVNFQDEKPIYILISQPKPSDKLKLTRNLVN